VAVTLLAHREKHLMRSIERYTGAALRVGVISGLEPAARPERGARPGSGSRDDRGRGAARRPEWKRNQTASGRRRDPS
jgi:hypothetical protein